MATQPTFAEKVMAFHLSVDFTGPLPPGIRLLNPFRENPEVTAIATAFYSRFYNDHTPRRLILGINPGRLGAGATGIPFTDTKRLREACGINMGSVNTHEPSSFFMYEMIAAFGGPTAFYQQYYISSVCPLGFTAINAAGRAVNHNYYDTPGLQKAVLPFIEWNIATQIALGCHTDTCFCLGTGKNYKFLHALNERTGWFGRIIPLEHPRFIIQYKLKEKGRYVAEYVGKLGNEGI